MATSPAAEPTVRPARFGRLGRVWALSAGLALSAIAAAIVMGDWPGVHPTRTVAWWGLAILFYLAEMAVLHFRFRRDAYSFSMSEIPLILGLVFASPMALVVGQVLGNATVLAFHRRQPPVKYAFNLAQFGVQSVVAVAIYRLILGSADPLGPAGWGAALVAAAGALLLADVLINVVIRLSGGRLSASEAVMVLMLSAVATAMNTSLGLVAGIVIDARPQGWFLGLAPGVILFVVYRAYATQRQEGARFEALYDATRALHASPQIESSLSAATAKARAIFDAEFSACVSGLSSFT